MKVTTVNYWRGSSFKDGGCFPLNLLDISGDLHPSYKYFQITILNFGIDIYFRSK